MSKKYEKEKDDIELNYAYAKNYITLKNTRVIILYKAYEYNVIAIKVFNDLGNEEKEENTIKRDTR